MAHDSIASNTRALGMTKDCLPVAGIIREQTIHRYEARRGPIA
jgi:hypothetical protein